MLVQETLVEVVDRPNGAREGGREDVEDDGVEGEDQRQDQGHDGLFPRVPVIVHLL